MRTQLSVALLVALMCVVSSNSWAACKRLGFTVNDYGKKGPIKDAKKLLDGYIKSWAKERDIKHYRVGKKKVTCELFLDVGFFDEHTCKASATFCWEGRAKPPKKAAKTN
jgi:hypothetical protein